MGLDMYLYRAPRVPAWPLAEHPERLLAADEAVMRFAESPEAAARVLRDTAPESAAVLLPALQRVGDRHWSVFEDVAYWRKANAIHAWFVDTVQDGVDDQRYALVTPDLLRRLRDTAQAALQEPARAPTLLPTRDGFLFGSTDYDAGYFADLRDTVTQLDQVLATTDPAQHVLLYHAWW